MNHIPYSLKMTLLTMVLTNCYTTQIAQEISDPRPDSVRMAEAKFASYVATTQTLRFESDLCVSPDATTVFECKYVIGASDSLDIIANPVILPDFSAVVSHAALEQCVGTFRIVNAQAVLQKEGSPSTFLVAIGEGSDSLCGLLFGFRSGRRFGFTRGSDGQLMALELSDSRPPPVSLGEPTFYDDIHVVHGTTKTVAAFVRAEKSTNNSPLQRYTIADRPIPTWRRAVYYGVGIPAALVIQGLAPVAIVVAAPLFIVVGVVGAAVDLGDKACFSGCVTPLKGSCIPYP